MDCCKIEISGIDNLEYLLYNVWSKDNPYHPDLNWVIDIQPQIFDEAKQVAISQGSTQKEIDTII